MPSAPLSSPIISFPISPQEIDYLFNSLDTDQSNDLSPQEVVQLFRAARIPPPSQCQVQNFFKTVDTNGDGKINRDEFRRYILKRQDDLHDLFQELIEQQQQQQQQQQPSSISRKFFTAKSLRKFALQSHVKLADKDVCAVMKYLDLNKDSVVTYEELCEALLLVPEVNPRAFIDSWFAAKLPLGVGMDSSPFESGIHPHRMSLPFHGILKSVIAEIMSVLFSKGENEKPEITSENCSTNTMSDSQYFEDYDENEFLRRMEEKFHLHGKKVEKSSAKKQKKNQEDDEEKATSTTTTPISQKILSGGVAGCMGKTVSAPLEVWRTKTMTSQVPESMIQTFQTAMSHGRGVRGLFVGNGINLIKAFPEMSIRLVSFDILRTKIAQDPHNVQFHERLVAGGLAGMLSQVSIYNIEVVRTRMMAADKTSYYFKESGNFLKCAKVIIAKEGYRALFAGLTPSLCGILPYSMIDLAVNDFLKDKAAEYYFSSSSSSPSSFSPLVLLSCGMISSAVAITFTHPLNVVRTRSQATGIGTMAIFKSLMAAEGVKGLFRGYFPTVVKVLPATGITYTAYDFLGK